MQDAYVGDIGDYGKYGLLRNISNTSLCLAINWYRVKSGKAFEYLNHPEKYRKYDSELFDKLVRIVMTEQQCKVEEVETIDIGVTCFFSEEIPERREMWHNQGLSKTQKADIVFLDPNTGLATRKMMEDGSYTKEHVLWNELKDYYDRNQSVILYQHRPRGKKREAVIEEITEFNRSYLTADFLFGLEFPKVTNRYYFFFCHNEHANELKRVIDYMDINWQDMCKRIEI